MEIMAGEVQAVDRNLYKTGALNVDLGDQRRLLGRSNV